MCTRLLVRLLDCTLSTELRLNPNHFFKSYGKEKNDVDSSNKSKRSNVILARFVFYSPPILRLFDCKRHPDLWAYR